MIKMGECTGGWEGGVEVGIWGGIGHLTKSYILIFKRFGGVPLKREGNTPTGYLMPASKNPSTKNELPLFELFANRVP